ncbi:PE family protein [Mycobacterium decipiens]|uniref:PE family protein n=1 Tax=Mycobacterium decipiens TaxID=1430326 RepID=A0A1X2LTJ4_9MYCO|nr:PE family protein [Mycobacterium decipiens]OSC40068.1 PE family protein [Mycobacterium decipiens]
MSFVTTQPEMLTASASKLQGIGAAMSANDASAAPATTGVVPAAADEVSTLTAALFAAHGELYLEVSARARAIHDFFVSTLQTSARSYAATETANATIAGA